MKSSNDVTQQQIEVSSPSTPTRRGFMRRFAAGAAAAAAAGTVLPAVAGGSSKLPVGEAFIGEITLFAGNFAPRGWAYCEGQTMQIAENQALFSILGTTYGGDGRTTFNLPDLKKAWSRLGGPKYIIAVAGIFPSRS